MARLLTSLLLASALLASAAEAGTYLFWLPMTARSTKIGVMPTAAELAKKGHEVIVVSGHKSKAEVDGVAEVVAECDVERALTAMSQHTLRSEKGLPPMSFMFTVGLECNEAALRDPTVKEILDGRKKIDVGVLVPLFSNEAGYYVFEKGNATVVHMEPTTFSLPWSNLAVGNPYNTAYTPNAMMMYSQDMSFGERLLNTLSAGGLTLIRRYVILPMVERTLRQNFPDEEFTGLAEMEKKTALMITHGSPFLADGLRPIMPNTILAGLMTCEPAKPLPKDLNDWVEGAKEGVIYISFGSAVQTSEMPEERRKLLLNVFSKLKERVIWKWGEDMPDKPANVKISPWLPQPDVLGHKNVKMFITHGGAGSVQETICHRKPVVGIPFFGDQPGNLKDVTVKKFGIVINWVDLTEENLSEAIGKILTDSSYAEAAKNIGDLIMDQPLHPLENAVWWLEYLLRHPGNPKMKSITVNMPWYQYFLLDVLIVIFAALFVFVYLLVSCFKYCCGTKTKQKIQGRKKKTN